jgi:TRAP-type C4-dicarboxylate transport system substrate-binding protein
MTTILFLISSEYTFAQIQIKIATLAPQNSEWAEKFQKGSIEIQERTENRVKLKFYWGGAQGNAKKILQKIKIRQLHGGTFSPTDFQELYPDLNIYGLPFLFKDFDEVDYVRDRVDNQLEQGFKKLGFNTYGFAGGGFAYILSNEPIREYEDLKNKKIWLPQGDLISYEAMRSLNLLPVPLPMTDVLTGLQTGLIDIVAIPPVVALALQWHTKINYITRVPVLYAMGFLAIDSKMINRINTDDRKVLNEVISRIYSEVDSNSQQDSENAYEALSKIGIQEIQFDGDEYQKLTDLLEEPTKKMANDGFYSLELFNEIKMYIDDFRKSSEIL